MTKINNKWGWFARSKRTRQDLVRKALLALTVVCQRNSRLYTCLVHVLCIFCCKLNIQQTIHRNYLDV